MIRFHQNQFCATQQCTLSSFVLETALCVALRGLGGRSFLQPSDCITPQLEAIAIAFVDCTFLVRSTVCIVFLFIVSFLCVFMCYVTAWVLHGQLNFPQGINKVFILSYLKLLLQRRNKLQEGREPSQPVTNHSKIKMILELLLKVLFKIRKYLPNSYTISILTAIILEYMASTFLVAFTFSAC